MRLQFLMHGLLDESQIFFFTTLAPLAVKFTQRHFRLRRPALVHQPAGGLGCEQDEAGAQQKWKDKLNRHGDAKASRVLAVLCGVVDDDAEDEADGYGQLVAVGQDTTEVGWGAVCNVQGYEARDETDGVA